MNIVALGSIALIGCGLICSPFLLFWAFYCLTRTGHRIEGLLILSFGAMATALIAALLVATAPPNKPAINSLQALIILPGCFGIGAATAKGLHFGASYWMAHRSVQQ
jgi:hypothetical protein